MTYDVLLVVLSVLSLFFHIFEDILGVWPGENGNCKVETKILFFWFWLAEDWKKQNKLLGSVQVSQNEINC